MTGEVSCSSSSWSINVFAIDTKVWFSILDWEIKDRNTCFAVIFGWTNLIYPPVSHQVHPFWIDSATSNTFLQVTEIDISPLRNFMQKNVVNWIHLSLLSFQRFSFSFFEKGLVFKPFRKLISSRVIPILSKSFGSITGCAPPLRLNLWWLLVDIQSYHKVLRHNNLIKFVIWNFFKNDLPTLAAILPKEATTASWIYFTACQIVVYYANQLK